MKLLIKIICVLSAVVFVASYQIFDKIEEAICKMQCINKMNSSCFACKDCECSPNQKPVLDSINRTKYGKSKPKLKCKSEDRFFVEWDSDFNPFDSSNHTAYFLHVKSSRGEFFTDVIFCHFYSIEGLNTNTSYSISLWGINDGFEIFVSKPLNVTTNERHKIPLPVSNITADLNPDVMSYEADVKWTPGKDLSCYYEIVLYCTKTNNENSVIPAPETYDNIPFEELFNFHIDGLHFGYTYDLIIRSIRADLENESESRNYSIYIPTCIETYRNLTICEPEKPENLTILETTSSSIDESFHNVYDIHIAWLKPSLIPDYYIAKLKIFDVNRHLNSTLTLNISGDANSATFEKIMLSSYHQVHLEALSTGGKSIAAVANRLSIPPRGITPIQEEKTHSLKTLLIIVGILGVVMVFGLLTIPIRQTRLNRINSKRENKYEEDRNIKQVQCTTKSQIVKETDKWEISIESLSFKTILGEGAFGIVWHALLDKTPVACKTLKDNSTADEIRELHQEIEIMKYVGSHPNIVSMVGCITDNVTNGPILIVEYCSNGDLLSYLRNIYNHISNQLNKFQEVEVQEESNDFTNKLYELDMNQSETQLSLSYIDVLSFGRQIALGMEYLSNQKVLHRDLAARNILMCDNKRVKVSDFGLSRDVYMDSVYCKTTAGKLPIRWMALESLTHQIYTSQSDVWSFGILLWEIVSFGALPYPGVESQELLRILKRGERMTKPQFCSDDIYSIMRNCWIDSPDDRPTFSFLREAFQALLTRESGYLELSTS